MKPLSEHLGPSSRPEADARSNPKDERLAAGEEQRDKEQAAMRWRCLACGAWWPVGVRQFDPDHYEPCRHETIMDEPVPAGLIGEWEQMLQQERAEGYVVAHSQDQVQEQPT